MLENYVIQNYSCIPPLGRYFEWSETLTKYVVLSGYTKAQILAAKRTFEALPASFLDLMD